MLLSAIPPLYCLYSLLLATCLSYYYTYTISLILILIDILYMQI